jgi:hypothetical protein
VGAVEAEVLEKVQQGRGGGGLVPVHLGPEEDVAGAGTHADEVERAAFHGASYLFHLEEVRRRLVEPAEL